MNSSSSIHSSTSSDTGSRKNKSVSPMRHIAVVSPPNCNGQYNSNCNYNCNEEVDGNNSNEMIYTADDTTDSYVGPESSSTVTIPLTRTPLENVTTATTTSKATTTTTQTPHRNTTSAFISYTPSSDQSNHQRHCIDNTAEHSEDHVHDDNYNDEKYTDLLCMEEILSLSDSNHSYQSLISNSNNKMYDDNNDYDDETTTCTMYDTSLSMARFWEIDDNYHSTCLG